MNPNVFVSLAPLAVGIVIVGFIAGLVLMWLAPGLRYTQGVLISIVGYGVASLLLAIYFIGKPVGGTSIYMDMAASVAWAFVAGAIITRLARNYGVMKTGWLGVGGKLIALMYLASFLLTAVTIAVKGIK